eukprot:TRINITY_DN90101_c0_g1_i1.p1 TRINITY_DN90101_c0_g1~~TRINITY_DN90101_c0_g1_i1.p1  ORF type:complete len:292 (-),score=53.60 TRINITY_DN90101_c0_g1_i1:69-944(-)
MSLRSEEVEVELGPQTVGCSGENPDQASALRQQLQSQAANQDAVCEFTGLPRVLQEASTFKERRLSLALVLVSVVDIVSSSVMMGVSFSFAYRAAGVSLYCLGIQAISHLLSSILLVIRFCGELGVPSDSEEGLLRQKRRQLLGREQALSITMGLVLLVSSASIVFKAFRKIKFWDEWYKDHHHMDEEAQWAEEFLAWYGSAFYFAQAVARYCFGRRLRQSLVWHAFWCSVVSLCFLFVMGFAASYEKEWSWKAEPICAIGLALVNLVEGVRITICYLDDIDTRMRFDSMA